MTIATALLNEPGSSFVSAAITYPNPNRIERL